MNAKEQQRLMVLNQIIGGELIGRGAATLVGLSVRQVRRLQAAYRKEGAAAPWPMAIADARPFMPYRLR